MKYLLLSLWLIFSLFSCQSSFEHTPLSVVPESDIFYHTNDSLITFEQGSIKTLLSANPENGELSLQLSLINASSEEWIIRYENATIMTEDSRRTSALTYGIKKVIIPPKSNQLIRFSFEPINSMPFYRKIDYKGDLKNRYYFPLSCIHSETEEILSQETLEFYLSEEMYQTYLKEYGKESGIRIYQFDLSEEFWGVYSPDEKPEVRDEEIHLKEIHLRFRLWQFADTLISEWKITNQSKEIVSIHPDQITIEYINKELKPLPLSKSARQALVNGKWMIRPGGKFQHEFRFPTATDLVKPTLTTDGIVLGKDRKSLFPEELNFSIDSSFVNRVNRN